MADREREGERDFPAPSKLDLPSPNTIRLKRKINKWDLIKPASFCTAKEALEKKKKEKKRQPTNREKILANNPTNKGLFSKLYKQFM